MFLEISQNSQQNTCTRLWHRCFAVNFVKFLRTPFWQNIVGRLLLSYLNIITWMVKRKIRVITYELRALKQELKLKGASSNLRASKSNSWVQIHELRVQIHELRFQIHKLGVQIHEFRVQIHEFKNHLINESSSKHP